MKACKENPVLLYHANESNFIMVLQSPFQASMLRQFSTKRTLCIDDTHGTNAYDFHLITLMVIDEFGEGFPVAWCISKHVDTSALIDFFQAIKDNVGEITPLFLMSDMADQFYNSWVATFSSTPKHILCTWHVLKAWKSNLKLVSDSAEKEKIYHILKVLMDETDEANFKKMIDKALMEMKENEKTKLFGDYFEKNYLAKYEQWAICFRSSSRVNTNMYVEAFHHILKYKFLKGKKNRRLDKLIQSLMEFLRHKHFDRLIKFEKGKVTGRIAVIQKRHNASKQLSLESVRNLDPDLWVVMSENQQCEYTVQQISEKCDENCGMRCNECNICVHLYSCTCPDSILQHTICKHVHLVAKFRQQCDLPKVNDALHTTLLNEIAQKQSICNSDSESMKHKIYSLLNDISSLVKINSNLEELATAENNLATIKDSLTTSANIMHPIKNKSSNKYIEKQRSFKLVKKHKKEKCASAIHRFMITRR